jgi:transposase InsO family protein
MHAAMRRAGWVVGRDQVARLMHTAGVRGVRRGKKVFTTVTDPAAMRPADLVERRFRADAPGQLWVADITYVPTWQGFAYTAFVTDVFHRKIVGWAVSSSLTTRALPLQALEMAAFMNPAGDALIHHSDRGVQYVSLAYSDRLSDLGIAASVGSRGDSYDNALAESVNAAYKAELIRARKPWRTIEEVEFATLEWVHWFNTARLHASLGHRTPAEVETDHYADQTRAPALTTT